MSNVIAIKEKKSSPVTDQNDSVDFEADLVVSLVVFLQAEAKRKNFDVTFYAEEVRYSERGLIILPVTTPETLPIHEESRLKRELGDTWNEQQMPPLRRVRLDYLWNPEISVRSTPPPLTQNV